MYGPLRRTYSFRLPGLVRGNEHSASSRAMKPRSGSASLAPTNWFHLIEAGEVVPRLGWGFAERLDGAAQIGQGFPDRNQLAALTLTWNGSSPLCAGAPCDATQSPRQLVRLVRA